jgi:hypothetical protein
MDDFVRYCEKAHLQINLLHWIVGQLAERQRTGNPAIDAIERDLKNYVEQYGQNLDFRFDRGDHLLTIAQFLVVGGVEAVNRISDETTKSEVVGFINQDQCLKDLLNLREIYQTLQPLRGECSRTTWTWASRMRNSLSHFRYSYIGETGHVCFRDIDPRTQKVTADFSMPLLQALNFSFLFGRACVLWAERNGTYPQQV